MTKKERIERLEETVRNLERNVFDLCFSRNNPSVTFHIEGGFHKMQLDSVLKQIIEQCGLEILPLQETRIVKKQEIKK